jgi:hypothetical protein
MHANCRIWGAFKGVPSDMLDGEMKNKHDILICLELLYHIPEASKGVRLSRGVLARAHGAHPLQH